jgi:hypothetical protein
MSPDYTKAANIIRCALAQCEGNPAANVARVRTDAEDFIWATFGRSESRAVAIGCIRRATSAELARAARQCQLARAFRALPTE